MTAALAAVCIAAAVWLGGRIRLGARARAAGGIRLRTRDRLAVLGARFSARTALLGGLAGTAAGGVMWLPGLLAGAAWRPVTAARAARARGRTLEAQIPVVARGLAVALRAGRSLPGALAAVAEEAPVPVRGAVEAALARIAVGASPEDAMDALEEQAPVPSARALSETIRVARTAGSNLPAVLDVLADALDERERIARDRRAATSQARLSAWIVASMPLAFYVVVGRGARPAMRVLVGTPAGWALAAAGIGLEVAGLLWMRRLVRFA